jgi:hypothetical protein
MLNRKVGESKALELVHVEICGRTRTKSFIECKIFLFLIDVFSHKS